ncbi:hypothetical protein E4U53_006108 [Claviceps sorghi]|nr:hypothetical protein E4U53_006108 [Claviceps sorghi]
MDEIGARVKREQHESIKITPVTAMETAQTTVGANAMSINYVDLTGYGDHGHGLDKPRPIKAEPEVTTEVVEIISPQLRATELQDTEDKINSLDFTEPRPIKAEVEVATEVVEILSPQLKATELQVTADKIESPGFSKPRSIKAELPVTSTEVVEIVSPQLKATELQVTADKIDSPGFSKPRSIKAELPVTSTEVVESVSPQLKATELQDTGEKINSPGFSELHPIKAELAVTPDIEEVTSFQPLSTICIDTEDDVTRLRSRANITQELEPKHSEIKSAALVDTIGSMMECDTESTYDDSSESELDDDERDKTYEEGSERLATKTKKNRRPAAKTAREFFARLQEKQKTCKTKQASGKAPRRSAGKATSDLGILAQLQQDVHNGESIRDVPATTMPGMSTRTHAEQLAIMCNSIPAGSDNRRKQTQKRDLKQAVKSFGHRAITAVDGDWRHRDMETALYSHQLTAASWMMERELVKAGPDGGILADEMGMGKTLMSLACVVGNPPEEADPKKVFRATLIIVPNMAVAEQWVEEAKKHLKKKIADYVMIYQAKSEQPRTILQQYWIMITTMHEVRQQFDFFENKAMQSEPSTQRSARISKKSCQLFDLKWYRVILDEAHAIKNLNSRTKYRWALTGTPLSNRTTGKAGTRYKQNKRIFRTALICTEFLPYLKFIGCNIEEDVYGFKKRYVADVSVENVERA